MPPKQHFYCGTIIQEQTIFTKLPLTTVFHYNQQVKHLLSVTGADN